MCTIGKSRMSDEEEAKISPRNASPRLTAFLTRNIKLIVRAEDPRLKQLLINEHIALYGFL